MRLDDQVKALLQHAASLRGRSMTDFLVDSAVEAAERVIKDASVISLGMEDARRFALLDGLRASATVGRTSCFSCACSDFCHRLPYAFRR